jgi:hypothetical protein
MSFVGSHAGLSLRLGLNIGSQEPHRVDTSDLYLSQLVQSLLKSQNPSIRRLHSDTSILIRISVYLALTRLVSNAKYFYPRHYDRRTKDVGRAIRPRSNLGCHTNPC